MEGEIKDKIRRTNELRGMILTMIKAGDMIGR